MILVELAPPEATSHKTPETAKSKCNNLSFLIHLKNCFSASLGLYLAIFIPIAIIATVAGILLWLYRRRLIYIYTLIHGLKRVNKKRIQT
jgi:hypothetical protein